MSDENRFLWRGARRERCYPPAAAAPAAISDTSRVINA